ncbi:hypothetical protein PGT21_015359 [Puccinia graminis f. sp. tritici]|uniref:Uncharacterized protein n=1 Tax=Puccinia graminis f. sp. tritici TaxID=56615 RepID=A0A5B0MLR5_PUCGR|nr:hypothetical protein PGTUg99_003155 [Puccinia graminis f. sp. tritici]KAA1092825.1 hypothetical protein PGT21_015359 [Puccinia graminis f. sp. tritici]
MPYSTNKNTIPFATPTTTTTTSSNDQLPRPSSESSTSSQPTTTTNSSPNKKNNNKKQSILRKLSTSSRRSLSWLPGIHPDLQSSTEDKPTNKIKFKKNSPPNSSNVEQHHQSTAKNVLGKGMRNVARTVKKSLHQFERPRSITAPNQDQQLQQDLQPSQPTPTQQQTTNIRTRAVSTSEVYSNNKQQQQQSDSFSRSLNQQPDLNSYPIQHNSSSSITTPPRSPKRLKKKKNRAQSAFEPLLNQTPAIEQDSTRAPPPGRLSWHAQTPVGSLPMAASILAAPSPPPIDHSSFMAILPGQPIVPALSVVPPPASLAVDPPILTAMSTKVEPSLSRRVSLSSSSNPNNNNNDPLSSSSSSSSVDDQINDPLNGFTFIKTPSKLPPPSPTPSAQLLSSNWTEILTTPSSPNSLTESHHHHQIRNIEIRDARPPLVSTSTSISLVHSCIAEHGSVADTDDVQISQQDVEPQNGLEASVETTRKRKVTSFINEQNPAKKKESSEGLEEAEESTPTATTEDEGERHHKLARSLDRPFSSTTLVPAHRHHTSSPTSHPFSLITTTTLSTTTTTSSMIRARKNSPKKDRKHSLRKPAHLNHQQQQQHNGKHRHAQPNPRHSASPASELWNFNIVSTVVAGVVIFAVVLIGSANLSGFHGNGKSSPSSWIGSVMKKIL